MMVYHEMAGFLRFMDAWSMPIDVHGIYVLICICIF